MNRSLLAALALALFLLRAGTAHAEAKTLRVASKAFTESVILAELVTQLEAEGYGWIKDEVAGAAA